MALTDAYATPAEARAFKNGLSTDNDVVLQQKLDAASRYIENRLGASFGFWSSDAPSTYVYAPGEQIYPIASDVGLVVKASPALSGVVWDDVAALVLNTDYTLEPAGALSMPVPRPIIRIRLLLWDPKSKPWLQVTGIHGWPGGVPTPIKWATIEVAYIISGESIYATDRIQESLEASVGASPQARGMLNRLYMDYARYGGLGIA